MVELLIHLSGSGGPDPQPASRVCDTALRFRCSTQMLAGNRSYNLKSVLSVLSAQATIREEAILRCEGCDEQEAARELSDLLQSVQGDPDNADRS